MTLAERGKALVARGQRILEWYEHGRVGRAVARYIKARGGLLAGGITYSALFSIAAALTIGFTAFTRVLGGNDELRERVLDAVNDALPGILQTGADDGLLAPDDLVLETVLTPASVAAAAVLVWTAVSMMRALRRSVRAMFGIVTPRESIVAGRVRDLGGFVLLALAVVLTAVLGIAAGAAGEWVMDLLGIEGAIASWGLRLLGIGVALAVDSAVFVLLFRVLAGVRAPRRDLVLGALIGGLAASTLRLAGTSVVGGADDPLLASVALLATLLVWVNLLARILLLVAAWTANPPAPPKPDSPEDTHYDERPNYVTLTVPGTLEWDYHATTGAVQASSTEREATLRRDLDRLGEEGLAMIAARRAAAEDRRRADDLLARERERAQDAARAEPVGRLTAAWRRLRRRR
ncbi:YihY/virulence factor BrkB family protein [Georgenia wangjunii]|uniref:YihY/virulence factor BrkB family protein n=1 Tax=Georgenia wangjunii TaxID=3117730 RepID=UPI002F264054